MHTKLGSSFIRLEKALAQSGRIAALETLDNQFGALTGPNKNAPGRHTSALRFFDLRPSLLFE